MSKRMIHLPMIPRGFLDLLGFSIRHHFTVVKKIFWLIVLLVAVKDWYVYLGGFPEQPVLLYLTSILMLIVMVYLISAMLYIAHAVLHNHAVTLSEAFAALRQRLGSLYSALGLFVLGPAILVIVSELILHMIDASGGNRYQYTGLIFVLVVGLPILYAYLRYFFTLPLIVTEGKTLWSAFDEASHLAKKNWLRVFGVYLCGIAVWLLVSPDTLHGHFMKAYHLSAAFDFIVFCVTLPIVMNLIVFMRNDLRLRQAVLDE